MIPNLALISHELLLFAACGFLFFGVDDLIVDIAWLCHLTRTRSKPKQDHVQLLVGDTALPVAVFVPAWAEAPVIGAMIDRCIRAWEGQAVCVFVGTYQNDPATQAVVALRLSDHVVMPVLDRDGPTTKADCLNGIWHAMIAHERESGVRFGTILLHDAEDHVHAAEIGLFRSQSSHYALVQIPVVPVLDPKSTWIAGHYADEFAESHLKELVVRQMVGASLPSAGTGCAVSRAALEQIAQERGGKPFDENSLTEDYELGLHIGQLGLGSQFVRLDSRETSDLVAVRSYFPANFADAVRQKTRWIIGIALAGWDRTGWRGGFAEHWMRWRDRRVILAALLIVSAYSGAFLMGLLWIVGRRPAPDDLLTDLLTVSLAMLIWRLTMRFTCSTIQHGLWQGAFAVPRAAVANIIAVAASFMAVIGYLRILWTGEVRWAKTDHRFPAHLDVP